MLLLLQGIPVSIPMSECNITVEPGVCKMNAKIHAEPSEDMMSVVVTIDTPCKMVKAFAEALKPVGAYDEFALPMVQNPVYKTASEHISHSACPIPSAVLKAIEVAADLGLKRDVSFKIE